MRDTLLLSAVPLGAISLFDCSALSTGGKSVTVVFRSKAVEVCDYQYPLRIGWLFSVLLTDEESRHIRMRKNNARLTTAILECIWVAVAFSCWMTAAVAVGQPPQCLSLLCLRLLAGWPLCVRVFQRAVRVRVDFDASLTFT